MFSSCANAFSFLLAGVSYGLWFSFYLCYHLQEYPNNFGVLFNGKLFASMTFLHHFKTEEALQVKGITEKQQERD